MREGTTIQSRQLGRYLRDLRKEAGLPADAVAKELGISEATLYRYENGTSVPRPPDVMAACHLYGANEQTREALTGLAKEASNPGWWRSNNGSVPRWFEPFISLEGAASHIRVYDGEGITGILQTEGYADATARITRPALSDSERQHGVAVRMKRQAILTRRAPQPPKLEVILGEVALARSVGPEIMAEQLARIDEVSRLPHVTVRILPIAAAHAAMWAGAFCILTFPDTRNAEPPTVYAENLAGALYLDKRAEVQTYDETWRAIEVTALPPNESRAKLREYMEGYR